MSNIIQNVKTGFANIKELLGIILSDDTTAEGYDMYINGSDAELAQTAQALKTIEEEQETKRLSLFNTMKITKKTTVKKNFKSEVTSENYGTSPKLKPKDVQLEDEREPEK